MGLKGYRGGARGGGVTQQKYSLYGSALRLSITHSANTMADHHDVGNEDTLFKGCTKYYKCAMNYVWRGMCQVVFFASITI